MGLFLFGRFAKPIESLHSVRCHHIGTCQIAPTQSYLRIGTSLLGKCAILFYHHCLCGLAPYREDCKQKHYG